MGFLDLTRPEHAYVFGFLQPFSTNDYLRGLVDADGSVGITSLGLPFVSFTTASEDLRGIAARAYEPL
jgi:LAGLIDADG-like domain